MSEKAAVYLECVMEFGLHILVLVFSWVVVPSSTSGTDREWDDLLVIELGKPATLACVDREMTSSMTVTWLKTVGKSEWKLVLSANEKKEIYVESSMDSMRLADKEHGDFSLVFVPKMGEEGLYCCSVKQQERNVTQRVILLAILTATVFPAPPPHDSILRLAASVRPAHAAHRITWAGPGGTPLRSEVNRKMKTLTKLPRFNQSDEGPYECVVHPQGFSSRATFSFRVVVKVDGPQIFTGSVAHVPFSLSCPPVLGDYVLVYWQSHDKQKAMQLVHQYDRWRDSTRTERGPLLRLAGPPFRPRAGSFSFLLSPAVQDGGLYICEVFLNEECYSQRTLLSVLTVRASTSAPPSELQLICQYSAMSQVQQAGWSHQDPSSRLQRFSTGPGLLVLNVSRPITASTAGNYTCTLRLKNGQAVWAVYTRLHGPPGPPGPDGRTRRRGQNYQPLALEKHTDSIIGWASVLWSLSYYSSPLLLCYLYRKGYICSSKLVPVGQYVGTALICLFGVACLRGWGRWKNSEYVQFISILEEARKNHTASNKKKLRCYDFDFYSWPLDFSWSEFSNPKLSKAGVSLLKPETSGAASGLLKHVRTLPCHVISFLIAHSFGRRMLYPGSVGLLQKAMRPMLQQGQAKLIEEFDGQRNKLEACDGNHIDTMFVDRRRDGAPGGKTLVICCEGNAGFYEVGCMNTPLEGGYSVLGWNHPGFGGSTGVPFPQNEANAMDVVIQFAVHKLGFQLNDIIIYAWSIGGFTASWAVMSYPELQAVVLDASFDDLLPLALKVMPESWTPLVQHTIRQYMNLNNAKQLCQYQGPVLLIRRTKDEIITTAGPDDIMSNRGNDLLLRLLHFRYPNVMAEEGVRVVRQWLGASNPVEEASVYSHYQVDDDWCVSVLQSYQTHIGPAFPWTV
ncbi:hypothetical protein NHX12_034390, partial [Muraenolepis orangiensis]